MELDGFSGRSVVVVGAGGGGIGTAIACQEAALAILKRIELVAHRPAARRSAQAA